MGTSTPTSVSFPPILRLPVLALTHSFDGRLTAPSLLLAWLVTGLFTSLLLWRVRIQIRGDAVLGVAEAVCCGVLVAVVNGGSVLLYLAASPKVSHEDVAWSVALTIGVLFALLGVAERPSPSSDGPCRSISRLRRPRPRPDRVRMHHCHLPARRMVRPGPRRTASVAASLFRWPSIGLGTLALQGLVNWAKLGMPYGLSEANQVWTQVNAHRRLYLASNHGNAFALHFLPSTLVAYLQPFGISVSSHFPFLGLPTGPAKAVGAVVLDQVYPTASIPASMPLLFLLGIWGVITAFRPHPIGRVQVMRLLLVAAAVGTAGVLLFGYIADRYLGDFLPFLALASMIGLVDVWRRFDGQGRRARSIAVAVVAAVGVFGVWVNIGAAISPTALWTTGQARAFVSEQRSLGGAPTRAHRKRSALLGARRNTLRHRVVLGPVPFLRVRLFDGAGPTAPARDVDRGGATGRHPPRAQSDLERTDRSRRVAGHDRHLRFHQGGVGANGYQPGPHGASWAGSSRLCRSRRRTRPTSR